MKLELLTREPEANARPTPILFIHGAYHGAWCWEEKFLPYFSSRGYISHAMSLRGHGRSEGHERLFWTSIEDYVNDVAQVVEGMEIPPILVGHSMGGYVVQKYLEKHRAPAAVLLASTPKKGILAFSMRFARKHPMPWLKFVVMLNPYQAVSTPELAKEMFLSPDVAEERVMECYTRLQNESYRATLDMFLLNLPKPKRVKKTPILILSAANDTISTIKEQEDTASAYGTSAEVCSDIAHDMMLEEGWQDIADKIIAWLHEQGL
jgi:alpha-beta hydrolase superfamily lysophospholipase